MNKRAAILDSYISRSDSLHLIENQHQQHESAPAMMGMDINDVAIIGAVTVATLLYFLYRGSGASKDSNRGGAQATAIAKGVASRDNRARTEGTSSG
ncbi:hypothetical protein HDU83_006823 [Entophlyctis luteolus]|nr:hypothetical protein HDU83_006823 [Entophlyctis luteolus]